MCECCHGTIVLMKRMTTMIKHAAMENICMDTNAKAINRMVPYMRLHCWSEEATSVRQGVPKQPWSLPALPGSLSAN